jgi:hypothetical protein
MPGAVKGYFFFVLVLVVVGFTTKPENSVNRSPIKGIDTVLKLSPGPNNPRNSEGDFVTLKDGKILFIYSHFTGNSGGDFGNGYLASRFSADNGKTWSKEDKTVVTRKVI